MSTVRLSLAELCAIPSLRHIRKAVRWTLETRYQMGERITPTAVEIDPACGVVRIFEGLLWRANAPLSVGGWDYVDTTCEVVS